MKQKTQKNFISYFKKILLSMILLSIFSEINAQEIDKQEGDTPILTLPKQYKHSINLEFFGRIFFPGSVNYEYAFNKKFSLGFGLGINNIENEDVYRKVDGEFEKGRSFNLKSSQMLYANYFIGKDKHKLLLTAGWSTMFFRDRDIYPSETISFTYLMAGWNVGVGYQLTYKRMYYRLTGYFLDLPRVWYFPDYIPMLGLSAGYTF